MRKLPRKIKVVLIIVGVVAVICFIKSQMSDSQMSDSQMIAYFQKHKGEFEQICQMLRQDKNVATIGNDWIQAKDGPDKTQSPEDKKLGIVTLHELPPNISKNRIEIYHSRMKNLGLVLVGGYDGKEIQMAAYVWGMGDNVWSKGYLWSMEKHQPVSSKDMVLLPIEDHWYIYNSR